MKPIYLKNNKTSECLKLVLLDNLSEQDMNFCLDMFPVDQYTPIPKQSFLPNHDSSANVIRNPNSGKSSGYFVLGNLLQPKRSWVDQPPNSTFYGDDFEDAKYFFDNRTVKRVLMPESSIKFGFEMGDKALFDLAKKLQLEATLRPKKLESILDFFDRMEADIELQQHLRLARFEIHLINSSFLTRWYWKRQIRKIKKELNITD